MTSDAVVAGFPRGRLTLEVTEICDDGWLAITVAEVSPGPPAMTVLGFASPLVVSDESRVWKFEWRRYVSYVVKNESFDCFEPGETARPDSFYRRQSSAFLEYVSRATTARDDYPGPLQAWALATLNHMLEVVSVEPPSVTLLRGQEV